MQKIFISTVLLIFCSTMVFAADKVAGTWDASIETENGPFEFQIVYNVEGAKISGRFVTDMGDLEFGPGKITGKEFEYEFEFDYTTYKHKGILINDDEILIKQTKDGETTEFTIKRAKG